MNVILMVAYQIMTSLRKKIFFSSSVEQTVAIAAAWTRSLQKGALISLEGPLGVGKTHFVKGVAVALNIKEEVSSPTFSLLKSYQGGEKTLHHLDFYRLEKEEEILELGLEDYLENSVTIIEWGDRFPKFFPTTTIRIVMKLIEGNLREISFLLPDEIYENTSF